MTDREKLIEILESTESAFYWSSADKSFVEKIADHLIANGVTFTKENPIVPGCDDQYNIAEMSYNNGYAKGYEEGSNRKHGRWIRRNHGQVSWVECSECFVCGSPAWVSCPVCDTKMEASNG